MTIREMIGQGFHYARSCKSLWLFGFFVGLASGGSSGGGAGRGGGAGGSAAGGGAALGLSPTQIVAIVLCLLVIAAAAIVMRFVSEGALIEGITKARQGGTMTVRDGFRAGWAHWGVIVRITLLYVAAILGSLVLLAAPCVIALRAIGPVGGIALGIPAIAVAVPWLITLYVVQAFAIRIAVLEHRRALDAIQKARLFLHGRLSHGLRLIVATFVGTLAIVIVAIVAIVPVVLLLVALVRVLPLLVVILLGCAVLAPAIYVFAAVTGTFRSSIWTIGYLTQVES